MDAFLKKLNGTEDSIQTALAASEADTLLDKMKQSEQRKIARVATELASLVESFRGFLAQGGNSSLKYVALLLNFGLALSHIGYLGQAFFS